MSEINDNISDSKKNVHRNIIDFLTKRTSKILFSGTDLNRNIRDFGSWFEFDISKSAEMENINEIIIDIDKDNNASIKNIEIDDKTVEFTLLWSFLNTLRINTLILDVRLERNQIEDIFGFLHCYKKNITNRDSISKHHGPTSKFYTKKGLHLACADIFICGNILKIDYSYCSLTFSKVTHWIEEKNKKFHDHRTFFYAAPKYSLLISLVVIGPVLLYSLKTGHLILSTILFFSTTALIALIYIFFMMVGSIEYDNEEKAYQLKKINLQLQKYLEKIKADIDKAKIIQEKFLPETDHMPLTDRIDWGISFNPAEDVGGDFFDVCLIDDDKVAIVFCDVVGHGLSAAFVTAIVKTTFQNWIDNVTDLENLAQQLNYNLTRLTPTGNFAAVFLAIYDSSNRTLTYTNCGQQPEPLYLPSDIGLNIKDLSSARNMILGIKKDCRFKCCKIDLKPNDMILFVSDGVTDANDPRDHMYGNNNLTELLKANHNCSCSELVNNIFTDVKIFMAGAKQNDDQTILAMKIKQ